MPKIELLAPAGNMEKLKVACIYGADAVYFGGSSYGLRAFAGNFTIPQIAEAVKFVHSMRKKAYVTVNIFPHNDDLEGLDDYLKSLYAAKVDAVLVSDLGIFSIVREVVPEMEIHISTQANNVNYKSAQYWHKLGAKRVVLARELSLDEIRTIREKTPETLDLEAFVHGAMCISYSGRCLLSSYMTGRDSNRGECAHPCRYNYALVEEKRPGQYMPVFEDERGSYILNSRDLCMIEHIPDLVKSGITSFKIEGRMKSSYYVATVVKAYRKALDEYFMQGENYHFDPKWLDELKRASHRQFSTGFYYNEPGQVYESSAYIRTHDIVGIVKDYDELNKIAVIEQRNRIYSGETIEIMGPDYNNFNLTLDKIWDENGEEIEATPHPQMIYRIKCDRKLKPFDMLIKQKEE